jgi:hypothetical protein
VAVLSGGNIDPVQLAGILTGSRAGQAGGAGGGSSGTMGEGAGGPAPA